MDNKLSFLDVLTILSFIIGIENFELNTKQLKNKAIQDEMLKTIIQQNNEIIKLLRENKHD